MRALGASLSQVIDGMNWLLLGKAPATYQTGIFGGLPERLAVVLSAAGLPVHQHDDLGAPRSDELARRAR